MNKNTLGTEACACVDRGIARAMRELTRALRLVSELPDLRAG